MLTRKISHYGFLALATVASAAALTAPARAEHLLYSDGPFSLTWLGNAGAGAFFVPDAQFGNGSKPSSTAGSTNQDMGWAEGWLKPEIKANYHTKSIGSFYVDASVIGAQTLGTGDASLTSATGGHPTGFGPEEVYVGWTGELPTQTGDSAAIQVGRQSFVVDDGFLIGDGNLDTGSRAAFYTAPRTAFDGYGVIKINSNPIRGDVFVLRNTSSKHITSDYPEITFGGFDAQWFKDAPGAGADGSVNYADRYAYAGVTAFKIFGASSLDATTVNTAENRYGMNVASVSFGGHLVPINAFDLAQNFTLYGQYVWEFRPGGLSEAGTTLPKLNANAYYIEPAYTFKALPLSPKVMYRYSHFSGQDPSPTASGTKTAYDPLFYTTGIRSSFGTYFMGEVVGLYNLFNTNENVQQLGVSLTPSWHVFDHGDSTTLDIYAYDFSLDHPYTLGGSRNYAREIDVIDEYQYNAAIYVAIAAGIALPGPAATDGVTGVGSGASTLRKPSEVVEAYFTYSF